jgi:hypothetical protein
VPTADSHHGCHLPLCQAVMLAEETQVERNPLRGGGCALLLSACVQLGENGFDVLAGVLQGEGAAPAEKRTRQELPESAAHAANDETIQIFISGLRVLFGSDCYSVCTFCQELHCG